jgi:hypothetical protein
VDWAGNSYVAMSSDNGEVFIRQYHADGSEGWSRELGHREWFRDISTAVDGWGNVYLAGAISGTPSDQSNAGEIDAFVSQYRADGSTGWTHQFVTEGAERATSVTANATGAIYLAGVIGTRFQHGSPFNQSDGYVMKVRPEGAPTVNPAAPIPPFDTAPDRTYFPETGHSLGAGFRTYWEANGGLAVFGFPMTEEFQALNADSGAWYSVQLFERQRFEWHPENAGSPFVVLLGRLGAELLARQGRDWHDLPVADPATPHYMPETSHAIAPEFWDYWSGHGLELSDPGTSFRESLALFGYPLSEPMLETNADGDTVLTQYFERAVFEWHPDNPPEWQVLLRRLGAEELAARGW